MERNEKVVDEELVCNVCGRECKPKAGLVIHRRRMHELSGKRKEFKCEECEEIFKQDPESQEGVWKCAG